MNYNNLLLFTFALIHYQINAVHFVHEDLQNYSKQVSNTKNERINETGKRGLKPSRVIFSRQLGAASPGADCGRGLVCSKPFRCSIHGKCLLPNRARCGKYPEHCEEGLHCIGPVGEKICHMAMSLNKPCEIDPYWVCKDGLKCIGKICKSDIASECTHSEDCVSPLICQDFEGNRKCVKELKLYDKCVDDSKENQYCNPSEGLTCDEGICKKKDSERCNEDTDCQNRSGCQGSPKHCQLNKKSTECSDSKKCRNGYFCDTKNECKKKSTVGLPCVKSFQCDDNLTCEKRICRISKNKECQVDGENGSHCLDGLSCVGPLGKKRCTKPMEVGGRCDIDPYWFCSENLLCQGSICRIPPNKECNRSVPRLRLCAFGTACIGPNGNEKCVPPSCRRKYGWCPNGMKCERIGRKCKVLDGNPCKNSRECFKNSICFENQCLGKVNIGGKCNNPEESVCGRGSFCEDGVCKITLGGNCSKSKHHCSKKSICKEGICRKISNIIKLGGMCDSSPGRQCPEGSECQNNRCKISENFNCRVQKKGDCTTGTKCVGPRKFKKCKRPRQIGEMCNDLYRICNENGICERGTCRLKKGQNCKTSSNCMLGDYCVGPQNKKKCKTPMKLNGRCGQDPYWFCHRNLSCERGYCKKNDGTDCSSSKECTATSTCDGKTGHMFCKSLLKVGQQCHKNSRYTICRKDLVCENGYCAHRIGSPCYEKKSMCANGATCSGPYGKRRCLRIGLLGDNCDIKLSKKCSSTLTCEKKLCKLKDGRFCKKDIDCLGGRLCIGPRGKEKCKEPMKFGDKCKTDPYWICQKGLICEDGRCKVREGQECRSTSNCVNGQKCVRIESSKRICKQFSELGAQCNGHNKICNDGLVCEKNQCKIAKGSRCLSDMECSEGSICSSKLGICAYLTHGETCGVKHRGKCSEGLKCDTKRRRCFLKENIECTGYSSHQNPCIHGTTCVGKKRKYCKRSLGLGQLCGIDPSWVCAESLACVRNKCCHRSRLPVGGDCGQKNSKCASNLKCLLIEGNKRRCVRALRNKVLQTFF